MCKEKHYHQLMRLEHEVERLLEKQTNISSIKSNVWFKVFFHILIQTTYDVIHLGIAARSYRSPVFSYVMPLIIVERLRYAQISVIIERQNERARCLIAALKLLVRANQPKLKFTSDIWQPYTVWEYEHLNWIRLIQGRLSELHQCVNKCFGWSVIALFFSTFFTIVSNLFWCIEISLYKFHLGQFTYDALTMLRLGTMVAVLLASAEKTKTNIMQISGLIFKLAKPLGNKAYNDLVSNLLLQCLHQRFIINVKGFFTLNISLLGNMIASSVTYLLILVQFLVSEEVDTKQTLGYKLMRNATNG
ncbi:gustatory receptor 23a-like [Anastrepha obliqua]|uniref:gustatory receptor 23a-like n=1 Tax=Anastrepha obliqua TaxID=95512 RepID=UPI00240A5128|nr:gustatory receptor 23a-like [Anastrepha obliqua]